MHTCTSTCILLCACTHVHVCVISGHVIVTKFSLHLHCIYIILKSIIVYTVYIFLLFLSSP